MSDTRAFIQRAGNYQWPDVEVKEYKPGHSQDVSRRTLLEPNGTQFEVRYFEVQAGGHTSFEEHEHEHCVVVIRGQGKVRLGGEWSELSLHDTVYVGPSVPHQFRNTGVEPFGILCVVDRERDRPTLLDSLGDPQTSD
ncbi:MAG TPA: cupin domain-containing protein [Fimbriimonadaceae bacterium]|nr:cupin domain-containing protein [Fimbriimonadaceae bacterium]